MIIKGRNYGRKIYFVGNSLTNYANGNVPCAYRYPTTCYNSLIAANPNAKLSMHCYAVPGILTSTLVTNAPTLIVPFITSNDIIVHWGITTDLASGGGLTAVQAEAQWDLLMPIFTATGAKVISCTMTSRNAAGDPADIETSRLAVNAYIRTNSFGVIISDVGANAAFDTQADTANATNYNADLLHLTDAGYDTIAGLVQTTIQSLL